MRKWLGSKRARNRQLIINLCEQTNDETVQMDLLQQQQKIAELQVQKIQRHSSSSFRSSVKNQSQNVLNDL